VEVVIAKNGSREKKCGELVGALPFTGPLLASGFATALVCGECDSLLDRWRSRVVRGPGKEHILVERFGPSGRLRRGIEVWEINDAGTICNHDLLPKAYEVICDNCRLPHFRSVTVLLGAFTEVVSIGKRETQVVLMADGSVSLRPVRERPRGGVYACQTMSTRPTSKRL
jgi:hypothetical protein